MPSNKPSAKTPNKKSKTPDNSIASAAEVVAPPETVSKPKAAKAVTTKSEMTSGKHHRKPASAPPVRSAEVVVPHAEAPAAQPPKLNDTPARAYTREDVAQLAHSYFVERGYTHGEAEDDWFRAEKALASSR